MDVGSSTSAIYSLFVPLPVPVPSADGSVVVSAFGSLGAAQAPSRPIAEMDTALTAAPFNRIPSRKYRTWFLPRLPDGLLSSPSDIDTIYQLI